MWEFKAHFKYVVGKGVVSALFFPAYAYPLFGGSKHGDGVILHPYFVSKTCRQLVQANLGDISPNAKDVGEVKNLYRFRHGAVPPLWALGNEVDLNQCIQSQAGYAYAGPRRQPPLRKV